MDTINKLKPIKRSKYRLIAGKIYYTLSRYLLWNSGKFKFAHHKILELLEYEYFSHKTLLLRELKDVDMQYQYNKIINLKIAVKKIDSIIIKPGETFSYWKLIGKPTFKKGYVPGMILFCGSYTMGIGGGLCQLSNLIYWMTLHTPLTIVERYRHSFDVFPDSNRTQPFGSGATCVYPYRDLMIRNDTNEDFQLKVSVGHSYLEGSWLSNNKPIYKYEVIEKNHQFKSEHWGGFSRHNELYRKRYSITGEFIDEQYITENHALMMYSPFLETSSEI
ncbi:VanW family protein [Alkalibaculum bacchi]|uniref:VanW family protein n=1 Tax=Alkalibaculum bacchi TaxID=645887 RepID=UPI0026EA0883|nr:VanW family protein [Alkalibaculum bacchi]